MNTNYMGAIALACLISGALHAQSDGVLDVTDSAGGNNEIHLSTTAGAKIGKIERWNRWTEKWEEVKPKCIDPNPGDDPVIDFGPKGPKTREGEKFRINYTSTSGQGNPFREGDRGVKFKKDKHEC